MNANISTFIMELPLSIAADSEIRSDIRFLHAKKEVAPNTADNWRWILMGITFFARKNFITLCILQSAAVPNESSMMNVLMSAFASLPAHHSLHCRPIIRFIAGPAFASSPADKIFTVLPKLPTQHFPSLTFSLRRSASEKNRERYLLDVPRV